VARKKAGLLTTGLSSELFLLTYLEPNNIRQLAQKLQNTSRNPTNYSKVSPAIHDLTIHKYLKHNQKDEKYYVNLKKLVEELELILKERDTTLEENEKLLLTKILERNEFFKILSQDIIKKIQEQEKGIHKINALEVFCSRIGMLSSGVLLQKKRDRSENLDLYDPEMSFEENMTEIKEMWKEIHDGIENKMNELNSPLMEHPLVKEFLLPLMKNLDSLMLFYVIPVTTLEKFTVLWESYEGVKLALDTIDAFRKD
jgi:hypothetical protein